MNAFEIRLERLEKHKAPQQIIDASTYVHDTLGTADCIAESLFGPQPRPELVIEIYKLIAARHIHAEGK